MESARLIGAIQEQKRSKIAEPMVSREYSAAPCRETRSNDGIEEWKEA